MAERNGSVEPKAVIVGIFGAGIVHWVNRRAGR